MHTAVIPFQLAIGGRGAGGYALRATAAGRVADAALDLPPLPDDPDALGAALGRALFPPPVRQLLIDVARGADEAGARVQIQLQVAPPELAALPWEWASLGRDAPWRPAVREDYTLVRSGRASRHAPPLALDGPVRLLIACAPGAAAAAATLGHALTTAVRSGSLLVDLLTDADPMSLREALAEEPCHALHLVADGATGSAGAARLRLDRGLDAAGLAAMLEAHPDLRLVTLAADPDAPGDTVADIAAALHRQIGVATLALGQLDHPAAAAFCGPCYTALALGDPLDLAVTDGRAALADSGGAWGAPRVWVAPGAEQLFDPAPAPDAPEFHSFAAREPAAPPASLPVGTPLRQRRDPAAPTRTSQALAAARSFVVEATQVGRPAQRQRPEPRGPLIQPKLLALIAATLVLAFMVSRVLPSDEAAGAAADAPPTPALLASAEAGLARQGNPLAVPEPRSYATYVTAAGDTLASIAERAGSDAAALANLNLLAPAEPLRPGRPLVVPIYGDGEPLTPAPIVGRGNSTAPNVALTFDIELDDVTLLGILDTLAAKGVRGTFFVTGDWVRRYPEAARAIVAGGHEIANHSLTHPSFATIGLDGAASELAETERIVREVTGASTRPYFRFPYGASTPEMIAAVASAGYVAYHWGADDIAIPAWVAKVTAAPTEGYGGILLMHGLPDTAAALGGWIDQLKAAGLTPTTLGETLR
jgi:peptidoglycan/xylan/chitin deacetylase (PgdA/CDA1 family)